MSATFGALTEVQFMHSICRFEAQEVNNPMFQTMHNLELKWRSYSHCKPITPSWRKNFAQRCEITFLLWDDFAAFLYSVVFPSWSFPSRWKLNTTSWKTTSQHCEISRLLWDDFAALFVPLRNLADLVCTCEMVPSASRYLRLNTWRYFSSDFCCLNPKILLVSHQL